MEQELYERLAYYLDKLPGGYPSTESGVGVRILKRLFTPEEAELALYLTMLPQEPQGVAHRAGLHRDEPARRIEEIALRRASVEAGMKEEIMGR
jgi:hypothetical protein